MSPACGQPAASALGLACAAGACLPFARRALVCAGLLLPLFGLFGSLHRGAGRCRRPAAVREACRRWARIPWRCFLACVFCRFLCLAWPGLRCRCLLFARRALCVRVFSLLSFTFSCLTFASQTSFHLSLRPRRASTFFRKESRQRFAKGLRPFEPHSSALRADLPFSRAAGRLSGPSGRKPPADKGNA